MTVEQFQALLRDRIETVDLDSAREDVVRFIREPSQLDIWSCGYFLDLARLVRVL